MVSLPQMESGGDKGKEDDARPEVCGTSCGAGLEKIYPTTAVRYGAMNWIGEFTYRAGTVFKCGAKVVIQTDRGIELGRQVSLTCNGCDKSVSRAQIQEYVKNSGAEYYRLGSGRILREATEQDLGECEHLNQNVKAECEDCQLMAAQLNLDMKIVTVEHLLGGERVVYYFMSEGRVDFRGLVRELAARHQTRIEMRQVGPRDEARLVADFEICGRECCCKNFLKTLRPVTMKMAKVQKATLDLSKVSGRCGRLRCCLRYEHEGYEHLAAKLPRVGSRIRTEHGVGTVVDRQILTQLVMFRTDDEKIITVPLESITEFNLPAPPRVPVAGGVEDDRSDERRSDRPRGLDRSPPGSQQRTTGGDEARDEGARSLNRRGPSAPHEGGMADEQEGGPFVAEEAEGERDEGEAGNASPGASGKSGSDAPRRRRRRGRRRRGRGPGPDGGAPPPGSNPPRRE